MKTLLGKLLLAVPFVVVTAYAQTAAIVGATVHTVGPQGSIANATVVFEDGVITAVGRNIDVPAGVEHIAGEGMIVTPGIFSPYGQLGLVEVGAVAGTVDSIQRGDAFSAGFDVTYAFNPNSTLIAINRIEGVTRAVIAPQPSEPDDQGNSSRVFSGLASVVHLGDEPEYLVRRGAALVTQLGETGGFVAGGSRAAAMMTLRTALDDAIDYARNKAAYDRGDWRDYSITATDLDALQGVLSGSVPLLVNADRKSDIESVLDLADDYSLRLIVLGGAEAWMLAERLAEADVSVILSATGNLPGNFDRLNARLESGAMLAAAGVRIAFGGDGSVQTHNARNLTQAAGNAVANGLGWDEALAAITRAPAEMYGVADRLGTVEVGKEADLVIWPADPLELTSYPRQVLIRGVAIPMESRQTLLRDRYLAPPDRPPAFRN